MPCRKSSRKATAHHNTLQHTAAYYLHAMRNALQKSCNTLQHTTTHCNTLQHTTYTPCGTPSRKAPSYSSERDSPSLRAHISFPFPSQTLENKKTNEYYAPLSFSSQFCARKRGREGGGVGGRREAKSECEKSERERRR